MLILKKFVVAFNSLFDMAYWKPMAATCNGSTSSDCH